MNIPISHNNYQDERKHNDKEVIFEFLAHRIQISLSVFRPSDDVIIDFEENICDDYDFYHDDIHGQWCKNVFYCVKVSPIS